MRIKKTLCDHCGSELDERKDWTGMEIEFGGLGFCVDLCRKCCEELSKSVISFCAEWNGHRQDDVRRKEG